MNKQACARRTNVLRAKSARVLAKVILTTMILGSLFIAALVLPTKAQFPPFWAIERMTATSGDSWFVDAEFDPDGTLHFTWLDNTPGSYEVYYNYRSSTGVYGTPYRVTSTGTDNKSPPRITACPNGDIVIAWSEDRSDTYGYSIWYRQKTTSGWQSAVRYTWSPVDNPQNPDVACNSQNHVSIAFDAGETQRHVYVDDVNNYVGGTYFSHATLPRIVYDKSNNLHLVYNDLLLPDPNNIGDFNSYEVRYRRRSSSGVWGTQTWVAGGGNQWAGTHAIFPNIAVGGPSNTVGIVYRQDWPGIGMSFSQNNELYARVGGITAKVDNYADYDPTFIVWPSIAVSSAGTTYVTWCRYYNNQMTILYAYSENNAVYSVYTLTASNIEKPIILLDETSSPAAPFILYEDYTLGGNSGELYLVRPPSKVATPIISPAGGTYDSALPVTISCATPGATIRYTTDGTTPTSTTGTVYSGAISVASSMTLKARAFKEGYTDSDVATELFYFFVAFDVVVGKDIYVVEVASNSSVSDLTLNQMWRRLRFSVDGADGTAGFCIIEIPEELMSGDFSLYRDDVLLIEDVDYSEIYNWRAGEYSFSISYVHSSHIIDIFATKVVPEFAGQLFIPFTMLATLLILLAAKYSEIASEKTTDYSKN